MTNSNPEAQAGQPEGGDTQQFFSGQMTWLAPFPLPTGVPPHDYARAIGNMNDRYLDLGIVNPSVFSWQMVFWGPMIIMLLLVVVLPLLVFWGGFHFGTGIEDAAPAFWEVLDFGWKFGAFGALVGLFLALLARVNAFRKLKTAIPVRFNRQRREVCFTSVEEFAGTVKVQPTFVPWEEIEAWVIQSQGGSQYGVMRQYGMGVGCKDPETGEPLQVEFMVGGLPSALGNWEALRAYMDFEIHDLHEIQDPFGFQKPGDPPHEGLHTFYNAREKMRERRRAGEVSWIFPFLWYAYHVMTLWTLPNHLLEWEIRKRAELARKALPESLRQWSEALPQDQWAQPSERVERLSRRVRELQRAYPETPAPEIFKQVYREEDGRQSCVG